jgi:hypothetical protein
LRYIRSRVFTFLFSMQKLSGTISGKNNKSCGIIHNKSKKNWVCSFLIFLRFSTQFTRISKTHVLLEIHFCNPTPEIFRFLTSRSLLCTQNPEKNRDDAIRSPGRTAAVRPQIWRGLAGVQPRESRGGT